MTHFLIKRCNNPGNPPAPTDLMVGELAINFPDQKLYTKEPGGTIIELTGGGGGGAGGTIPGVTWAAITGKPTTFPPGVHTHVWTDITGKPTTFPPAVHTHAWNAITGKPSTFPPSTHSHTWSMITGKPATYPPTIGLTGTTAAAGNHGHTWAQIRNKPSTLAGFGITDAALATHDHDGDYLKLTGGTLTGNLILDTLKGTSVRMAALNAAGQLVARPLASYGMTFIGVRTPGALPAGKRGDFVVFNGPGSIPGHTLRVKAGDMAVHDGTKWELIPAAEDLSAYITRPTVNAAGFLYRSGGNVKSWRKVPWTEISGQPKLLQLGSTATTAAAGNHNHDNRYVRYSGNFSTAHIPIASGTHIIKTSPVVINVAAKHIELPTGWTLKGGVLAGGGTRMVVADRAGVMGTQAIPQGEVKKNGNLTLDHLIVGTGTDTIKASAVSVSDSAKTIRTPTGWKLGIGVAPAVACHVSGEIVATGDVTGFYSDIRLKENINYLSGALDKVCALRGFTYTPNQRALDEGAINDSKQRVGVSAQDVEKVLPEAVRMAPFDLDVDGGSKSGKDYKTVQYEKLVPLLIEGMRDAKKLIDELRAEIEELKNAN
jgi:hypothetical protein